MGMAYSKAWRIVRSAEEALGCKLLDSTIGGRHGGGAALTEEAEALLRVAGLGLEGGEAPETGADVMDLELEKSMELRKDIRQFASDNPEIAAQMIKVWLKGGDGNG